MMLGNGFDPIAIKQKLMKRGFQILILLGLFVILLQPKINVKDKMVKQDMSNPQYFQDIDLKLGNEVPATIKELNNTVSQSFGKDTAEYRAMKAKEKLIQYNKKLIMLECVRIEPRLSKWYDFTNMERRDIPTFEYILYELENKLGEEQLYGDVQRGVDIILNYVRNYKGE